MSAKILLVRTGPDLFQAKSYVAVESGLYTRDLANPAELEKTLKTEQFDLVIHDGCKLTQEPLTLSENIRTHQRTAPILLLCAKPEMDVIVRAIRLGVRDLFTPAESGRFFCPCLRTAPAQAQWAHRSHRPTLPAGIDLVSRGRVFSPANKPRPVSGQSV